MEVSRSSSSSASFSSVSGAPTAKSQVAVAPAVPPPVIDRVEVPLEDRIALPREDPPTLPQPIVAAPIDHDRRNRIVGFGGGSAVLAVAGIAFAVATGSATGLVSYLTIGIAATCFLTALLALSILVIELMTPSVRSGRPEAR